MSVILGIIGFHHPEHASSQHQSGQYLHPVQVHEPIQLFTKFDKKKIFHLEASPPSGSIRYMIRKVNFANGEFYHIYNRGVDKRAIFSDDYDMKRFFQSMEEFNVEKAIGSLYENSFLKKDQTKVRHGDQLGSEASKLESYSIVFNFQKSNQIL